MAHRTTKNWTWTKAAADLMAASLGAATPTFTLDGTKLKFAQEIPGGDNGFAQVIGDFTLSDFDGYADHTLSEIGGTAPALVGPVNLDASNIGLNVTVNSVCSADQEDPGQLIKAAVLTTGTDTVCLGYEIFSAEDQVPILNDGDYLQYDLRLPIPEKTIMS